MKREDSSKIKSIALKEGMTTMIQDGFSKVLKGLTTIEEVLRVIHE
jgi:type II secretory ATPase GspE/PulE/Tfp pilus assembly ATPase PilB-like protein